MVCGIKSSFKMHKVKRIFIPHDFQHSIKLVIRIPVLKHNRHKIKKRDNVGDITNFLGHAMKPLAGSPQQITMICEYARRFRICSGSRGSNICDPRKVSNSGIFAAQTAIRFRTAEHIKNSHTLIESGVNIPCPIRPKAVHPSRTPINTEFFASQWNEQVLQGIFQAELPYHLFLIVTNKLLFHFIAGYIIIRYLHAFAAFQQKTFLHYIGQSKIMQEECGLG